MANIWRSSIAAVSLGGIMLLLSCTSQSLAPIAAPPAQLTAENSPVPEPEIRYQQYVLPEATVHTVLIPAQRLNLALSSAPDSTQNPDQNSAQDHVVVVPAISSGVDTLENFVQTHQAIAAINGGFFDPQNQKSTSYMVQQGEQVADPRQNERLMENPDLSPYLDKILNRAEFRRYRCGRGDRYDITLHDEPVPSDCELLDALGAGPQLLPDLTLEQEGFLDTVNGEVIRDALGSRQPNARSAIGMTNDGSILWVMVAQKPELPNDSGMSLPELANWMKTMGVVKAMNLDGGSSSAIYFRNLLPNVSQDIAYYGKVDAEGNPVERPVKTVLLLKRDTGH